MTPEQTIADAIRNVTVAVQRAIEEGHRSRMIDADDLVEVLLAVALDAVLILEAAPPFPGLGLHALAGLRIGHHDRLFVEAGHYFAGPRAEKPLDCCFIGWFPPRRRQEPTAARLRREASSLRAKKRPSRLGPRADGC
jgi:hypothetical protein